MLGLFSADLPIGRRVWQIILVIVISGALVRGEISFSNEPIRFVIDILLFYGYIVILQFGILIPFEILDDLYDKEKRKTLTKYEAVIGRSPAKQWAASLFDLAFLVAIILALPHYGTDTMSRLGTLGLGIQAISEVAILDIFSYQLQTLVELRKDVSNRVYARIIRPDQDDTYFLLSHDMTKEIGVLHQCGWQPLELSSRHSEAVVLFSKCDRAELHLPTNKRKK